MGGSGKKSKNQYAVHLHFQTLTDRYDFNSTFDPFSGKMYGNKKSKIDEGIYGLEGESPSASWFKKQGYGSQSMSGATDEKTLQKNIENGFDYSNYYE